MPHWLPPSASLRSVRNWAIVLLFLANAIALYRLRATQTELALGPPSVQRSGLSTLRPLLNQNPQQAATASSDLAIVFLFKVQDCPATVEEIQALNRLALARPDFRILGIMGNADAAEAKQTQNAFQLGFPVLPDPQSRILGALNPPRTPWKLVLHVPTSQILLEDGPSVTPPEAEAFFERVRTIRMGS